MSLKAINNRVIGAVKVKGIDNREPLGSDIFPGTYSNVFLCAKKKSGKTNVLHSIVPELTDGTTEFYIFCSTAERDPTWISLIKLLKKRGSKVHVQTGILDKVKRGKKEVKVNYLEDMINGFTNEKPKKKQKGGKEKETFDREERVPRPFERKINRGQLSENHLVHTLFPKPNMLKGDGDREEIIKKEDVVKNDNSNLVVPEKCVIFDDLSGELSNRYVPAFLKKNRHYKALTLVSSQFVNDLWQSARSQFDIIIAFKGHDGKKLEELHRMSDSDISFKEFSNMYHDATREQYNFFYIDCRNNKFRKNFDQEYATDGGEVDNVDNV